MATLVHLGAGGNIFSAGDRAVPLIRSGGARTLSQSICRATTARAGLAEYADIIIRAVAERRVVVVRGGDKVFHWSGGDLRPRRSKIQPVVRRSFVLRTKGSRRDVCRGSLRGGSAICFQ